MALERIHSLFVIELMTINNVGKEFGKEDICHQHTTSVPIRVTMEPSFRSDALRIVA